MSSKIKLRENTENKLRIKLLYERELCERERERERGGGGGGDGGTGEIGGD